LNFSKIPEKFFPPKASLPYMAGVISIQIPFRPVPIDWTFPGPLIYAIGHLRITRKNLRQSDLSDANNTHFRCRPFFIVVKNPGMAGVNWE
jgi:hypothetical protein